jgi:hypothetical protein
MRTCWLLAIGVVMGLLGVRAAAAEDSAPTMRRNSSSANSDNSDGARATLAALRSAVRMPPIRRQSPAAAYVPVDRPAKIVRLAKPYPHAGTEETPAESSLDMLAARLVSHSEAAVESAASAANEPVETKSASVRPATAWTPTDVGNVEEEVEVPAASSRGTPTAASEPALMHAEFPAASSRAMPTVISQPQAVPSVISQPIEPVLIQAEVPAQSSRAVVTDTSDQVRITVSGGTNPLRQSSGGAFSSRSSSNPLRDASGSR